MVLVLLWSATSSVTLSGVGLDWGERKLENINTREISRGIIVVQSLSRVRLFMTPWTAACQASLSFTMSWAWSKWSLIWWGHPTNLILCCTLLLLPSIFSSIRVFSNELPVCISWPKYWSKGIRVGVFEVPQVLTFQVEKGLRKRHKISKRFSLSTNPYFTLKGGPGSSKNTNPFSWSLESFFLSSFFSIQSQLKLKLASPSLTTWLQL